MSCFQCDLDIPHVCYAGMPGARWGMGDEAVAALDGAQRYLARSLPDQRPPRMGSRKKTQRRGRS